MKAPAMPKSASDHFRSSAVLDVSAGSGSAQLSIVNLEGGHAVASLPPSPVTSNRRGDHARLQSEARSRLPDGDAIVSGEEEKALSDGHDPGVKEIIAALEVDGPVVVELKGFVQKLQSSEASGGDSYDNRTEIRVELRQVEAYPTRPTRKRPTTTKTKSRR
jgi:hypothetical protein